jgi:hypothetical protein
MTAARFTRADVERAIAGATKAGLMVSGVEITPDGTIRLLAAQGKQEHALMSDPIDLVEWKRR